MRDGSQEIFLSAASAWEVAIKTKIGKFALPLDPRQYVPQRLAVQGIRSLSITQEQTLSVYDLPLHHSDPFDRIIIAQAITEKMTVLTSDRIFAKYPVDVLWCGP
jgi:PIN domain nuclease of toxin-antitoxin system